MKFDEHVNKILHEAHFNSPYEKATGIKRQINMQEDHGTEFGEGKARKNKVMMHAADAVIDEFESNPNMDKKEMAELSIATLAQFASNDQFGGMAGDEFTLDDMKKYFAAIGAHTTGKAPMSTERYRNIEKDAVLKLRKLMGAGAMQKHDPDVETDPDKLAAARDRLQQWRGGSQM